MNDNIDDWLNSLGLNESPADDNTLPAVTTPIEESAVANGDLPPEPSTRTLSEEDFDDILEDLGFNQSQEAEAEEISDEEEEEIDEEEEQLENWQEIDNLEQNALDAYQAVVDYNAHEDSSDLEQTEAPITTQMVPDIAEAIANAARPIEAEFREGIGIVDALTGTLLMDQETIDRQNNSEQEVSTPADEGPLIPLNSPTLLLDESTTRFSGAEWYNEIQKQSIIFAGIGGIGSNCCFQLARMHPAALFLYDDDMVETVNMAGQLYARDDVGKSKVSAISGMISSYTNMMNVYAIKDKFTSSTEPGDVMMCGFDNMEARKTFFESWIAHIENKSLEEKKRCLFLDGRLSMTDLQVFCLTGDDYANQCRYAHEFLFSDEEAEHTVCSMKQTTYLACMIGSIMTNLFTNWVAGLLDPIIPYDLPFFTEYDAQNMIFKTVK